MTIDQIVQQLRAEVQEGRAKSAKLTFEVTADHVLTEVQATTATKRHAQALAREEELLQQSIAANDLELASLQLVANLRETIQAKG